MDTKIDGSYKKRVRINGHFEDEKEVSDQVFSGGGTSDKWVPKVRMTKFIEKLALTRSLEFM